MRFSEGFIFLRLAQNHYYMMVNEWLVCDAATMGNLARFINHSCNPNCAVVVWAVSGLPRVGIFALRKIEAGEELTIGYNYHPFKGNDPQVCHCKETNCRGVIIGNLVRSFATRGGADEKRRTSRLHFTAH